MSPSKYRYLLAHAGLAMLLHPLAALAADSAPVRAYRMVERLAKGVQTVWPTLAQEQTDMAFYRSAQILASDGQRAWLIDARGFRPIGIKSVRALNLPADGGTYAPLQWRGRPTVYLGIAGDLADEQDRCPTNGSCQTWDDLFSLATHEALHFYGQKNWLDPTGTSRDTPFPFQLASRQYRGQLLLRLRDALEGKPQALGHASYWFKRWKAEYPDEALDTAYTDRYEGVAMYVDRLAVTLASGVPRDPAQWRRVLLKQADHDLEYRVGVTADEESYALGMLAGALLERRGGAWWQRVAKGSTPLDLLLQNEQPIVNEADPALNGLIERTVQRRLARVGPALTAFLQDWQAADSRILLIPATALRGSFQSGGSFSVNQPPKSLIHGFKGTFALSGGRAQIKAATVAPVNTAVDCSQASGGFYAITLASEDLSPARDGRLRLGKPTLDIDIPFPQQSGALPRMYCAQV